MNVLFLDYDGVVNTPMWDVNGSNCSFNFPQDGKVNNFQCVQWVSEFCEKHNYDIVVTSTWRLGSNYKLCLQNGGLRAGVEIIGRTPSLSEGCRGDEIQAYLDEHPEVKNFIIVDDEDDMGHLNDHLVLCNTNIGFGANEFFAAEDLNAKLFHGKDEASGVEYGINADGNLYLGDSKSGYNLQDTPENRERVLHDFYRCVH